MQLNKKLGRAVDYTDAPKVNGVREGTVKCYTFDPNDPTSDRVLIDTVSPESAHKWIQGIETRGEFPETDVSVDEMLSVIANQLEAECAVVMEYALSHAETMERLYKTALGKSGYGSSLGRFRLMRPYW